MTKYWSVEQAARGIAYRPFSYLQDAGSLQWSCCSSGVECSALQLGYGIHFATSGNTNPTTQLHILQHPYLSTIS